MALVDCAVRELSPGTEDELAAVEGQAEPPAAADVRPGRCEALGLSAAEYDRGLAVKAYEKALQYPHNPHKAKHQQALNSLPST